MNKATIHFLHFSTKILHMAFDIKEIKKLPKKEKYKLIGQIWDSIDDPPPGIYTKAEEEKLIFERQESVKQGTIKSDSWENAKKRLMKKADERLKPQAKDVHS